MRKPERIEWGTVVEKYYEKLKHCPCCNGTGIVEGEYIEDIESCLTCSGSGNL